MHKIATRMELCFTSWLDHVDAHRTEYPELNYFTTEQLVILQHEFSKLQENQEPSKKIYPMLHNISQNCNPGIYILIKSFTYYIYLGTYFLSKICLYVT